MAVMGLFLATVDESSKDVVFVAPVYEAMKDGDGCTIPLHDVVLTYWDNNDKQVRDIWLHSGTSVVANTPDQSAVPEFVQGSPFIAPTYVPGSMVRACVAADGDCKGFFGVRLNEATFRLAGAWKAGAVDDGTRYILLNKNKEPKSEELPMPAILGALATSRVVVSVDDEGLSAHAGGLRELIGHVFDDQQAICDDLKTLGLDILTAGGTLVLPRPASMCAEAAVAADADPDLT